MENGDLVKRMTAHFQRIVEIKSLVVGTNNEIITSSIDRCIKIWNLDYIFEKECDADNKCVFHHGIVITEIQSVATSEIIHLPQINTRNNQPLPITIHCNSKCKLKGRKLPFDFSKIIFEGPIEGNLNFNNFNIIKVMGNDIRILNE